MVLCTYTLYNTAEAEPEGGGRGGGGGGGGPNFTLSMIFDLILLCN